MTAADSVLAGIVAAVFGGLAAIIIRNPGNLGHRGQLSGRAALRVVVLAAVVVVPAVGAIVVTAPNAHAAPLDRPPVIRTEWMPCGTEDDNGCVWTARLRGNGFGSSFYANKHGRVFVLPHVMAETLVHGRITRPAGGAR
jgi:hypothetical protein